MNRPDVITLCLLAFATIPVLVMIIVARKQISRAGETAFECLAAFCASAGTKLRRLKGKISS